MGIKFDFENVPLIEIAYEGQFSENLIDLCRFLSKSVYEGEIIKDQEQYGLFIHDDVLNNFVKQTLDLSNEISESLSVTKSEVFEQLLVFVRMNYTNTSTPEETRNRSFVDQSKSSWLYYGTWFNFNQLPDWESFESRVRLLLDQKE